MALLPLKSNYKTNCINSTASKLTLSKIKVTRVQLKSITFSSFIRSIKFLRFGLCIPAYTLISQKFSLDIIEIKTHFV